MRYTLNEYKLNVDPSPQLVVILPILNLGCAVVKRSWTVEGFEGVGGEGVDHAGLASPRWPN